MENFFLAAQLKAKNLRSIKCYLEALFIENVVQSLKNGRTPESVVMGLEEHLTMKGNGGNDECRWMIGKLSELV